MYLLRNCSHLLSRLRQKTTGALLDERSRALAGEPSWIRSNIEVFSHSGTMTAHDWIQIITKAGDFILHNLFGVRHS